MKRPRSRTPFFLPLLLSAMAFLTACGEDEKPTTPPAKPPKPTAAEKPPAPAAPKQSFAEARAGFKTKLLREESEGYPTPEPPPELFDLIRYPAPLGKMDAYVSVDPGDGKKYPAIIWIVGGFGNSISEAPWEPATADNDQSAATFWKAGIITMYPSLRGGNESPGFKEGLFGEVDDVIAAAKHLAALPYVDPDRIYLGGHSVGGTLALLVAETTDQFRAVFSFGPVASTSLYGARHLPYDVRDPGEIKMRSAIAWLHSIKNPTFIFEGYDGNSGAIAILTQAAEKYPLVKTYGIFGADHFSIIRPVSELVAERILGDMAPDSPGVDFTREEIKAAVK